MLSRDQSIALLEKYTWVEISPESGGIASETYTR